MDIGCGNGTVSKCFSEMGAKITAIDTSNSIFQNRKRYHEIKFLQMSVFDMKFKNEFDIVYSKGVLHHTGDTYKGFLKAVEAVKGGGILYV